MKPTLCYQTDDAGLFLYQVEAYPFPLEDRLNVPYLAVQVAPPAVPEGSRARWLSPFKPIDPEYDTAGEWTIEEIPVEPETQEQHQDAEPDPQSPAEDETPAQA